MNSKNLKAGFVLSLLSGILCFVLFNLNGSYVAADGTLVESFAYIPIGYLFIGISVVCGAVLLFKKYKNTSAK